MLETKLKNTYKKLIHYFSIFTIILGTTFGSINSAYAADGDNGDAGGTEVADGVVIIATNTAGIIESGEAGATTITITSGDAAITLGANNSDDAVTLDSADDEQYTISTSGTGTITFAGDIDLAGAGDDLNIVVTTADVIVGNDLDENAAMTTNFQLGVANGANITSTLIIDNQTDENQNLSAVDNIVGLDADDTTELKFRSSGTNTSDNVTTLGGVVGGAGNAAIDTVTVG